MLSHSVGSCAKKEISGSPLAWKKFEREEHIYVYIISVHTSLNIILVIHFGANFNNGQFQSMILSINLFIMNIA